MIVTQIAAMAKNGVIGVDNGLPWQIPEDMKFFRTTTKGHILIMGRKTFESFGGPLKSRYHIVITRNTDYSYDSDMVSVVHSLEQALDLAKTLTDQWGSEVFIAGGGEIYSQALPHSDKVYLTIIEKEFKGDTLFPNLDDRHWKKTQTSSRTEPIPFSFNTFERITEDSP